MTSTVETQLVALYQRHGVLTPELVVDEARKKDSPLHEHFEWDVKKAAAQHWLDTARALIRSVRLQVVNETRVLTAPMFVRDPALPSHQQGYVRTADLRGDDDRARDLVADECSRAASAFRRAREVAAAVGVESDVAMLFQQTVALGERIRATVTPSGE